MMLPLGRQERYRRRYARRNPEWQPASHAYRNLIAAHLHGDDRVLDLGCGRGGVMEELHDQTVLTVGLDPDLGSLREHRARAMRRTCGESTALPYRDDTFDLICSSWVFEHLRRPRSAFVEVARVLRPGGALVFLTPNSRHPLIILNRLLGWTRGRLVDSLYGREEPDIFPAYYRANSLRVIRRLAREAGFERATIRPVGDPTYLAFNDRLFDLSCLLARATPRAMRVHLVGTCVLR